MTPKIYLKQFLGRYFAMPKIQLFFATIFLLSNAHAQQTAYELALETFTLSPQVIDPMQDTLKIQLTFSTEVPVSQFFYAKIDFYISKDSILNYNGDEWAGTRPYLKPGLNQLQISPNFIYNRPPGNYYMISTLSYQGGDTDIDKTNNRNITPFTILESNNDLIVRNLNVETASLAPGLTSTIKYDFERIGYVAPDSLKVGFYLSKDSDFDEEDIFVGTNYYAPYLYYGQTAAVIDQVTLPANIPLGEYYLLAKADPFNYYEETNEQNNLSAFAVTLKVLDIDLTVQDVHATYTYVDTTIHIDGRLVNLGTSQNVFNDADLFFSVDTVFNPAQDLYLGQLYNHAPVGNNRVDYKVPASLPEGTYYIFFSADHTNKINETNEHNNVTRVEVFIPRTSDIDLTYIPLNDVERFTSNALISFDVVVKNNGTGYSKTQLVQLNFKEEKGYYFSLAERFLLDPMAPGEEDTIRYNFTLPSKGKYTFQYLVDWSHSNFEFDETNNVYEEYVIYDQLTANTDRMQNKQLSVYPMPARDEFFIESQHGAQYILTDAYGHQVWSHLGTGTSLQVNCATLGKGIYVLREDKAGIMTQKKIVVY